MLIRHPDPDDYTPIITVLNDWWGGRQMREMLPRLFFVHFRNTSLVVVEGNMMIGFLVGFLSQTCPNEAYIHFVGVDPVKRRHGIGAALYDHFFRLAREQGRTVIHCVTSPANTGSIAFHTRMGFTVEDGRSADGEPHVARGYDGPDQDRVRFVKRL